MTDDDRHVKDFEAWFHRPVTVVPWTPVTPYDLESRRVVEDIHPQLILETFHPRAVLDYGCGPDAILLRLIAERDTAVSLHGYDPQLRPRWREQYGHPCERADLVICREVLEHCTGPQVVDIVAALVARSSHYIYVTTRFAKHATHLLDVEDERDVDPTHITCVTKPFLRLLFVLQGCQSRPDLEARMDWQHKGRCLVFEKSPTTPSSVGTSTP